jgi:hypothetical protein
MEEKKPHALEMGQKEEKAHQAKAEAKSRRAIIAFKYLSSE